MKRFLLPIAAICLLVACNNSKKENGTTTTTTDSPNVTSAPVPTTENNSSYAPDAGASSINFSVNDTVKNTRGSVLVQKDDSKLSPGNELFAMVTASAGNDESFIFNFLFSPKPGTYPVVGLAYTRPQQVFGGLLGGKPKMTSYKVNLTEATDLGSNNMGGHKWKISGSIDGDVTIDAMEVMKMNKNHPDNVKVSKISFSNLTFDDNWSQIMEEGIKKMKGN